jgi:AcrR family transcriptional regulator
VVPVVKRVSIELTMRADAIRNRKKLLDVAERIFTMKGASAEMDEIARAAGVEIGRAHV